MPRKPLCIPYVIPKTYWLKAREACCATDMLSRQFEATNEASRVFDDSTTQCLLFAEIFAKPAVCSLPSAYVP